MRRVLLSSLAAALLVGALAGPAGARPVPTSYTHQAQAVTLSDADGDILRSDGNPTYTGRDVSSTRITDYTDPAKPDRFQFQAWGKRRVRIQSSAVGDGSALTCDFNYIVFQNSTTPNWYEQLSDGSASSVVSDAFFICDVGSTRYKVMYPDGGGTECALIERPDATTWRFRVGAYVVDPILGGTSGCPATLRTSVKEKGQTTETEQSGISAPFTLTVSIP